MSEILAILALVNQLNASVPEPVKPVVKAPVEVVEPAPKYDELAQASRRNWCLKVFRGCSRFTESRKRGCLQTCDRYARGDWEL